MEDAVERHFDSSNSDPFVWFDVFSVSQHKSDFLDFKFKWSQGTFLNAVGYMGHVLMVMLPWNEQTGAILSWKEESPTTLTRFDASSRLAAARPHICRLATHRDSLSMPALLCFTASLLLGIQQKGRPPPPLP